MDAGLITGAPAPEASATIQPANPQGSARVGQASGQTDTSDNDDQQSFANALQQSSDALPGNGATQASPAVVTSRTAGSQTTASTESAKVALLRSQIGNREATESADASTAQHEAQVATMNAQRALDAGVTQKDAVLLKPDASDATQTANAGISAKSNAKKITSQALNGSSPENAVVASPQQATPSVPAINVSVSVTNAAPVAAQDVTAPAIGPLVVGSASSGVKPGSTGSKASRSDAGVRGAGPDKTESAAVSGTSALDAESASAVARPASVAPSSIPVVNLAGEVNTAVSATGTAASAVAQLAPATHVSGDSATASLTSSGFGANMHGNVGQTDSTTNTTLEHATLVATPNVLEVGVSSGTHGWVRVRAELSAGGDVTASMKAVSEASFDSLHKELPAISAYLATESVGVSSLVVEHAPAMSGTGAGLTDSGAASAQGGDQGAQGNSQDGTSASTSTWAVGSAEGTDADTVLANLALTGSALSPASYGGTSGSWLSVRA